MANQVILDFVREQKNRMPTNGIVICGSYTQGRYGPHSDIDIVFLTASDSKVEAQHISYHGTLFHRLTASANRLQQFLVVSTEDPFAIAVLHSLTADIEILEDSLPLRELIGHAKSLVSERGITFDPQDRRAIILHGHRYQITKEADRWKLIPAGAARVG
jgi:predicted nucleotidyltransferase